MKQHLDMAVFLSLIKLVSRLVTLVADGPAPTLQEKQSGERALLGFDDVFFIFTFFDVLVGIVCVCDAFRS